MKRTSICLIASHGGHLHELTKAVGDLQYDHYWVTFRTKHTQMRLKNQKHYFIIDPHLTKWKYLINGIQSLYHLTRERPKVIISTGAGIAIPTLLLGKFFCHSKIIYIESAANITNPSHTAKFMYRYADLFLTQWDDLRISDFPNAITVGVL